MYLRLIIIGYSIVTFISPALSATEKHESHSPTMSHATPSNVVALPEEGGQSTFAALIEIVALLEANPETDWTVVDIDRLHSHLLDMNALILDSVASKEVLSDTRIQFTVTGTPESVPSIHTMVSNHSRFIQQSRGWSIKTELNNTGATVAINVKDKTTITRLAALGFYGFMSLDSHHQAHHLQIALGGSH